MNQTKIKDKVYDPAKTWFFSDPHFDHNNVLKFEQGLHDFQSIEEHDAAIIERWNSVVQEDDIVFFLGDASMPRIKLHYLKWIFSQLKGQIIWLKGNHDTHIGEEWRKELCEVANIVEFKDYAEISMQDPTANHGTRKIVLFHYPILEFNGKFHGAFHLYGHSHQIVHPIKNAYSVCACITGYGPINFEWIKEKIAKHNEGLDRPGKSDIQSTSI
jgi:calcineurin-like phosphoesterase family protein